jgi:hypothetical protein
MTNQDKKAEEAEKEMMDCAGKKREDWSTDEIQIVAPAYKIKGKSLVLLQVNCRNIYNKILEFWNLVDTYNPDCRTTSRGTVSGRDGESYLQPKNKQSTWRGGHYSKAN